MLRFESSDEEIFELAQEEAFLSETLKNIVEDCGHGEKIHVNAPASHLRIVTRWCKRYWQAKSEAPLDTPPTPPPVLDEEHLDLGEMVDLMNTVNYLDCKVLLEQILEFISEMIYLTKEPENLCYILGIPFDAEEIKAVENSAACKELIEKIF